MPTSSVPPLFKLHAVRLGVASGIRHPASCFPLSSTVSDARYMLGSANSVTIVTALELPRFRLCDDSLMVSASASIPSVWWSSVELSFDFALR